MEDIARSAGVAKGTIYNYFKGKEELLHALAEGIAGVMHRNLENVTSSENEGLPLKDRLMKVVAPLTDGTPRSKRNLRVFRLVWAEGLRSPEIMHDLYARLFVPVFRNDGLLARMLEKEDVPDFVRNRPVVLVAPLIQSIFIHVLVGNELIMTDTGEKTFFMRWLPVLTLTLCTFVFNTSEFIPIGLLTDIGRDFGRTEAEMGWLVTTYAWVVALMSLPLMLLASKMECRRLMMSVLALFVASHVLSAVASNYWILLASRLGVACSHAIFWSVVSPLAVEVAPKHKTSAALGLVVAGSSIAMIAGLPLGRVLGLYLGWRMTFLAIGLVAAIALVCLWRFFPSVHSRNAVALDKVPALLSRPALMGIYILTPLIMTGNFTVYSYIEPFLAQVTGMLPDRITWVLVAYGAVGILGSWIFSHFFDRRPIGFLQFSVFGIVASLFLMAPLGGGELTIVLLCIFWGLAVTLYNLVFQSAIIRAVPSGTAVAMSVYSGIYNVGIGSGALVGGLVCTHASIADIGWAGGAIAAAGALFCLLRVGPVMRGVFAKS